MASILKVDEMQGVTSAGDITITGEGTATMRLQQGLAKSWANVDGSGTAAIRDSLNTSSLVDNGTGSYTIFFNNDFANDTFSFTYCGGQSGAETTYQMDTSIQFSTSHNVQLKNAAGSETDRDFICGTFHGDLA